MRSSFYKNRIIRYKNSHHNRNLFNFKPNDYLNNQQSKLYSRKIFLTISSFIFSTILTMTNTILPANAEIDLKEEAFNYKENLMSQAKEPKQIMKKLYVDLQPNKRIKTIISDEDLEKSGQRVLTLKAYLDEIERYHMLFIFSIM